jgi:hypothetical protein
MYVGLLLALILASFRLTRLITRDMITEPLRSRVPQTLQLDVLVHCDWCAGVWVAGLVTLLTDAFTSVPAPVLTWGAVAGGLGLLASWEGS